MHIGRHADTLGEGGPLATLAPLLPSVCHMAVCQASAELAPGGDAVAAPQGGGGEAEVAAWGEAALISALTAVRFRS